MSLNSIMLLGKTSPRTWLIFTVLLLMAVLSETRRNWDDESAEINQDRKSKEKGDTSDSNSGDDSDKKDMSKEKHDKADISDNSESDDMDDTARLHSTRGLKAEEFEPEDTRGGNAKNSQTFDNESDDSSKRRRRSVKDMNNEGIEKSNQ